MPVEPHAGMPAAGSHGLMGPAVWVPQAPQAPAYDGLPVGLLYDISLVPGLMSSGAQGSASGSGTGVTTAAMMPTPFTRASSLPQMAAQLQPAAAMAWAPTAERAATLPAWPGMVPQGVDPGMLASTQDMLSGGAPGAAAPLVGYGLTSEQITRVSLKVFNVTHDHLMPAVREELESLLQVGAR